jgi:hypothetical protein
VAVAAAFAKSWPAMIARRPRPKSSAPPKQRRRRRSGWPLSEAEEAAEIREGDRRAIQSAIAEWEGRTERPPPPQDQVGCDGHVRQELAAAAVGPRRH